MRQLIGILVAILTLGRVAFAPLVFGAAASVSITQEEAENFVRSFYTDFEGDDLDKVMAHFDQTVEFYAVGLKEQAFIANQLGQYLIYYPARSFSITAVKLKPSSKPDRVTVNFDLHSFLRNPERDTTRSGHAHVEWDLVKRDGALKIIRFTGTEAKESATSPSP